MTDLDTPANSFEELRFALAEGDALRPPAGLVDTVRFRAFETRPPGVPAGAPAPIDPRRAFERAVASLDALLGALGPDEWNRPALRDLDVQGLVGHLVGVERGFIVALEASDDAHADDDHIATTDPYARRQKGRTPFDTMSEWHATVEETAQLLDRVLSEPDGFDKPMALYGVRLGLGQLLVVRTFELWTHEEDIRRATGRDLPEPDAASLRLMTTLAVQLVPAGMARANVAGDGRSARLVLTGPGGGTWQLGLGLGDMGRSAEGPVDVRIVADAVDFCRLVANRLDPAGIAAVIAGDHGLARDLFAGVTTLALD
jgi:uncharacterized protein (TIGR03083 family)